MALAISYWPALLYAEMGAALPLAGGTYNYARKGLNRFVANLAGWSYAIGAICCCGGETLAFSNYFSFLLKGFGIDLNIDPRIIAIILLTIFVIINFRGVQIAGRYQNACMFFFWGCSVLWFLFMIPQTDMSNFFPKAVIEFPGFTNFVTIVGLVWWCFAGFETIAGMGGEIKYPQIVIPRVMKISPFLVFAITAIFQWFLVSLVSADFYEILQNAEAPYAEGLMVMGITGLPLIILCLAIAFGGDLSTINPGVGNPARYIYQMSQDGCLPGFFGKIHPRFRTPYISILAVGVITLLLVSTNSIIYIASVSLFAILICYIIGFFSYIGPHIRYKDLKRPYKAPAGIVGSVVSIIIYFVLITQIGTEALITGIIFSLISIVYYLLKTRVFKKDIADVDIAALVDKDYEAPGEAEAVKMKHSYYIWMAVGIGASLVAVGLYLVPRLLS
jgi:APA family basic amino acid/polyamine antiporter